MQNYRHLLMYAEFRTFVLKRQRRVRKTTITFATICLPSRHNTQPLRSVEFNENREHKQPSSRVAT